MATEEAFNEAKKNLVKQIRLTRTAINMYTEIDVDVYDAKTGDCNAKLKTIRDKLELATNLTDEIVEDAEGENNAEAKATRIAEVQRLKAEIVRDVKDNEKKVKTAAFALLNPEVKEKPSSMESDVHNKNVGQPKTILMNWRSVAIAIVVLVLALGLVLYKTPPDTIERFSNETNAFLGNVNVTAVLQYFFGKDFINHIMLNKDDRAVNKFIGKIREDENNDNSPTNNLQEKIYNNFKEQHVCEVLGKTQHEEFDEIIENVGSDLGLPEKLKEKMKKSKYSEDTSFSVSHFDQSSNGMYIYGRFESVRNKNKDMDIMLAIYKVSWTLPSREEIESAKHEYHKQWVQLQNGNNGMIADLLQNNELKASFEKLLKLTEKEAVTMKVSKDLEVSLRKLAGQKNKDECHPRILERSSKNGD